MAKPTTADRLNAARTELDATNRQFADLEVPAGNIPRQNLGRLLL
jgi:hypothetical protein